MLIPSLHDPSVLVLAFRAHDVLALRENVNDVDTPYWLQVIEPKNARRFLDSQHSTRDRAFDRFVEMARS